MLRTKFSRHMTAFLIFVLASFLLYPLAQAGLFPYTLPFLGLAIFAAILTLSTK